MIEPSSVNRLEWTEERKAEAIRLFSSGLSASLVAKRLKGISRNAVLGMLHRAGALNKKSAESTRDRLLKEARAAKGARKKAMHFEPSPPERLALRRFSWDQDNGLNNG